MRLFLVLAQANAALILGMMRPEAGITNQRFLNIDVHVFPPGVISGGCGCLFRPTNPTARIISTRNRSFPQVVLRSASRYQAICWNFEAFDSAEAIARNKAGVSPRAPGHHLPESRGREFSGSRLDEEIDPADPREG